ncbi:Mobile element protein [Sinorhizobium alkalisoli]|nr:Mobile element protein [Sinorhizobium alkalisoli]
MSSGLHRGRVRSLENSLEANHADDSRSISSANRYSRRSWRNFRLVGIEQIDLAGDSSVTLQREDFPTHHHRRRHCWPVFVFCRASPEGQMAKEHTLPNGGDSRGRTGWLLAGTNAEQGSLDRNPHRRGRIDCHAAPASPGEGPYRRRNADPRIDGMETWRAPCVLNGQTSLARGRRQPTDWTGAENSDCGTCLPRQSHKGAALHARNSGLPTCQSRSPRASGRASDWRWSAALETFESRNLQRTRSPRIAAHTNQGCRSRARCLDRPRDVGDTEGSDRPFGHQGNRARIRYYTLHRRAVPTLRQSTPNRLVRRPCPSPWQSGNVNREQGVSKAGNPRLRATMVELAWLWLRHQPKSTLTLWFKERIARNAGRLKTPMIVALARKLLVALWKYVSSGVVIEGVIMKTA